VQVGAPACALVSCVADELRRTIVIWVVSLGLGWERLVFPLSLLQISGFALLVYARRAAVLLVSADAAPRTGTARSCSTTSSGPRSRRSSRRLLSTSARRRAGSSRARTPRLLRPPPRTCLPPPPPAASGSTSYPRTVRARRVSARAASRRCALASNARSTSRAKRRRGQREGVAKVSYVFERNDRTVLTSSVHLLCLMLSVQFSLRHANVIFRIDDILVYEARVHAADRLLLPSSTMSNTNDLWRTTPLVRSHHLSTRTGREIYLKLEVPALRTPAGSSHAHCRAPGACRTCSHATRSSSAGSPRSSRTPRSSTARGCTA
jgi:hypothetical protein